MSDTVQRPFGKSLPRVFQSSSASTLTARCRGDVLKMPAPLVLEVASLAVLSHPCEGRTQRA